MKESDYMKMQEASDARAISQANAVKELGDQIGYGNMMCMCAALWRRHLVENGLPISGAFTVDGEGDNRIYDSFVDVLYNQNNFWKP